MTKFAIERYVSEHRARELECVPLKRLSRNTTPWKCTHPR